MTAHDFLAGDARLIADIRATAVNVSDKSNWVFVEIEMEDGATGLGEATLHGYEPLVMLCLDQHRAVYRGATLDMLAGGLTPGRVTAAGLAGHAAISALEQARLDLVGKAAGKPLCALYGHAVASVPAYANINRGLPDRTADGFASRAAEVARAGFDRLKIAPFDGVSPSASDGAANEALVQAGLDRIRAVRMAVGPDVAVMVDCHWRFDPDRAKRFIEEVSGEDLFWIECPISETPAQFVSIEALRKVANDAGMLLAGAEMSMGLEAFTPFIELYDVIMPDVKYCGGPSELLRIADAAAAAGTLVAPHNPSGPVATGHSIHLAAHPAIDLLELQHNETPLFEAVICGGDLGLQSGYLSAGAGLGLGLTLNHGVCEKHPWQIVSPPG